jgi:hypothetical protein
VLALSLAIAAAAIHGHKLVCCTCRKASLIVEFIILSYYLRWMLIRLSLGNFKWRALLHAKEKENIC